MSTAASSQAYQELRPLMFAIAYRMLGSVSEAEDIVQEAFLRYHRAVTRSPADAPHSDKAETGAAAPAGVIGPAGPESPKAYLSAIVTRLCIDHQRSARVRREAYVGEWLPEPLLTGQGAAAAGPAAPGPGADPADLAEQTDSLSMAFLLLLERLSPVERAVFLLHDVFSYGYDETAQIVGKSQDNCRQLARRARQHVAEHRPRYEPSPGKRDELAGKFFAAVSDGDMDGLLELLAADATVYGDSGGMRPSWPRPIVGRDRVGRLLIGLASQVRQAGATLRATQVNGQPGALVLAPDGSLINVFTLDIADGQVQTIRSVISRDKLRHLGPLADVRAMLSALRNPPAEPAGPPAP
jgi:RNA polymerase sigma-70 factor (ECF subfamily)